MPGRLRTASNPFKTLMESAPYSASTPGTLSVWSLMKCFRLTAAKKAAITCPESRASTALDIGSECGFSKVYRHFVIGKPRPVMGQEFPAHMVARCAAYYMQTGEAEYPMDSAP